MTWKMASFPKPFAFGDFHVFNADDLRASFPAFFVGCTTNRKIVDRKQIPPGAFHFASYGAKSGWKPCSVDYNRGKVLLTDAWVCANVPGMNVVDGGTAEVELAVAPPLLLLEEREKFRGADGATLKIETRGERSPNKVFFKVSDVSRAFDMVSLKEVLLKSDSGYVRGCHFTNFLSTSPVSSSGRERTAKRLYLTYPGMVRLLFVSRSGHADRFQQWAIDLLFAAQMGTAEQRQAAASSVLGMSVDDIKRMQATAGGSKMSAVYLFSLGDVKSLRARSDLMGLSPETPDEAVVYKYGRTDDLGRRASDHHRDFVGKGLTAEVRLSSFAYVDDDLLPDAETSLREFFVGMGLTKRIVFDERRELVIVMPSEQAFVAKYFATVGQLFAGKVREEAAKHTCVVKDLQHTVAMKDKELELKDMEIQKLGVQLENEQLKRMLIEARKIT